MARIQVNGETRQVSAGPDTPLLWVLRDELGLTGTKFGCGVGACGACTVHLDGLPVRACRVTLGAASGTAVVTIEGLADSGAPTVGGLHPVQEAWIREQVPQCGYCQSGMIMTAAALLERNPAPSDAEIEAAMTNLCRCGSYPRVRQAIRTLAAKA